MVEGGFLENVSPVRRYSSRVTQRFSPEISETSCGFISQQFGSLYSYTIHPSFGDEYTGVFAKCECKFKKRQRWRERCFLSRDTNLFRYALHLLMICFGLLRAILIENGAKRSRMIARVKSTIMCLYLKFMKDEGQY